MPNFNIVKECKFKKTFRVSSIIDKFALSVNDVIKETFIGDIKIENEKWNIGLIVGNSGTGKTTIAKEVFNSFVEYEYKADSVIDDFNKNKSINDILKVLNSCGFSSPPSWIKPYSVLSNGEKMRINIARSILDDKEIIVFDEFTSVIDRNVAKIGSHAISKSIKKLNKKFIAVSCHFDIIDWIEPDWIFDTNENKFFFVHTKDQKLKLESKKECGIFLGNIII